MATPNKTAYRGIFKATSLFGGVQVYQIFVSVVKSKFIAVLLGPLGVGILGLYQSALHFIQSLTSMGLSSSAVRNVSEANGSGDVERIADVVKTLRRLVWCTGLLGLVVILAFSPLLSKSSFGNNKHIIPFMCLSITLLLDQICAGQKVVLQGMRRLKDLAKASAIGSTVSLLVSVPLYYLYGVNGIVPTLILHSVTLLLLSWYYARQVSLPLVGQSINETIAKGRNMLAMGLAMSWSGILVHGCAYLLRGYIRIETGTEAVGLYTAGFTIINTYVGMIFTAIGTDYYPRLAGVNNNNEKMKDVVNQQGEIAFLILAPLLVLCIVFMPLLIRFLYSDKFLGANTFIMIAAVGMLFKLCSWLIAYQFIAKGDSRLFVVNETVTNIYFFVFNILGYKIWGLAGLGLAFALSYLIYSVQVFIIARNKYNYGFSREFKRIMLIQFFFVLGCFAVRMLAGQIVTYIVGFIIVLVSSIYSFRELNKRMELTSFLMHKNNGHDFDIHRNKIR